MSTGVSFGAVGRATNGCDRLALANQPSRDMADEA
jgi:hypothetical protein